MIPILYEKDEMQFTNNGLGRLRDCLSFQVSEERNGVFEADFEYPTTGAHFDEITVGRIVVVTHDDTGDVQPFDIVSYERPIDGVVKFHCTHVSYRLSYYTVTGYPQRPGHLIDALDYIENYITPASPFKFGFESGWNPAGTPPIFDFIPHTARSMLGGTEGSVLDTYGGEFFFDHFRVALQRDRGQMRNVTIRYGVNLLDYSEEYSTEGAYSACVPYWTDGTTRVRGDRQVGNIATITGRGETVPLDVSDKFENKPTKAQVEAAGLAVLNNDRPAVPVQTISVEFLRLRDVMPELSSLETCRLCDTIKVIFPGTNSTGNFKIVKTVWDVLADRYVSMELGTLSTTLSQALGIGSGGSISSGGGFSVLDFYPVGSYYETSDAAFDPNVAWGGTWQKDSAGRVTVAQDTTQTEFDTLGETGGSKYIQAHAHSFTQPTISMKYTNNSPTNGSSARANGGGTSTATNWATASGGAVGGVQTTSHGTMTTGSSGNLQPYIVVIRWHRTA